MHLAELRATQALKRQRLYGQTETDEVAAISKLAAQLWGDGRKTTPDSGGHYGGLVEFDRNPITAGRMGVWKIGYYLSPPGPINFEPKRRRRIMFQGASYAEIFAQVVAWKARRA